MHDEQIEVMRVEGILATFRFVVCQSGGQWYAVERHARIASDSIEGVTAQESDAVLGGLTAELNAQGVEAPYVLFTGVHRVADLDTSDLLEDVLQDEDVSARIRQGVSVERIALEKALGGPYTQEVWAEIIRLGMVMSGVLHFFRTRTDGHVNYVLARTPQGAEARHAQLTGRLSDIGAVLVDTASSERLNRYDLA